MPPVRPMLAKSVKGVPDPDKHGGLSFEPKWDGFRCLLFKDGDEVELTSRNTKPLTRYFPELVEAARAQLPDRCVLDGEVFVALPRGSGGRELEFEVLQERIHPAASRITMLSEKTPAEYVAFDLLALGDRAARHVGVDVERLRMGAIVVVALLTAAAVAFCGIIAFVGLVVPHLVRLLAGPGHRLLVPASALGGGLLLVVADLGARTLVAYADLPIGMLTSLVGGPFFFWLIRRARRTSGAWA